MPAFKNLIQKMNKLQSNSPANKYFNRRFPNCPKEFVLALAQVSSVENDIYLSENDQQSKPSCIRWFDKHFSILQPFLDTKICVLDSNLQQIGAETPESREIQDAYMNQNLQHEV